MTNILWGNFESRVFSSSSENGASVWNQVDKLLQRSDKFLDERPLQPKRAIQEYAAQNGIQVPKRFDSLEEALASGKKFIIRSEHPQEYAGISGLSESYVADPAKIAKYQEWKTESELSRPAITEQEQLDDMINEGTELFGLNGDKAKMFGENIKWDIRDLSLGRIWHISQEEILRTLTLLSDGAFVAYSAKVDADVNEVLSEQSYTFWEYIEGINHTVIRDKDIENRYYIVSKGSYEEWWEDKSYYDMVIIQDWEVVREWGYFGAHKSWTLSEDAREIEFKWIFNHNSLIQKYERIRGLPKFDPNHYPIMEFQSSLTGQEYFLQSHRGCDITSKEDFTLNRELEEWEIELEFFRGVTSPEWIIVETGSYYVSDGKEGNWSYPVCEEEASFDMHYDHIFSQIMARKRQVQFWNYKSFDWETMCINSGHASIAEMFKADIYAPLPDEMFKWIPFWKISDITSSMWVPYKIKLRVISDGKRCFVKRITTDEEILADHEKYNIPIMDRVRKKRRWDIEVDDKFTIKGKV